MKKDLLFYNTFYFYFRKIIVNFFKKYFIIINIFGKIFKIIK